VTDSTLDITQSFDRPQKLLKLYDNGDGTYSVASGSKVVDVHGHIANVQAVADSISGDEYGLITNAIIHGRSTAGGGSWVDVKVNPSGSLQIDGTVEATRQDDLYNDAFQRLRVSNTDQRFDVEFKYDKSPLLMDDISVTGTTTFNANSRDVTLATASTSTAVSAGLRQHFPNPYTPGNSQFIALTGVINGANLAGRAEVFLRSSVTGSVTEEVIPQSSWIGATNGMNWQYSQIFLMDFQSLKVGRIRFGVDMAGIAVPVAVIENDNERATGYWQLADQPIYWRQYNTASYTYTEIGYGDELNAIGFRFRTNTPQSTQTMLAICGTVKSEGGGDLHEVAGTKASTSNGVTTRAVSTTYVPVLSLQVKTTLNTYPVHGLIFPESFSLYYDNAIYYEIRVNPTLTGAVWASVGADSIANRDITATAVTGGRVVYSDYGSPTAAGVRSSVKGILDKIPLAVSALDVGDILSICCIRMTTTNSNVAAAMNWNEVR
jgi:hypothetical protein